MPSRTTPSPTVPLADGLSPNPNTVQVHLLVLVHGMWGFANHLTSLANTIRERYPQSALASGDPEVVELEVLVAQTNESNHTYDGIDLGGERVVAEMRGRIEAIEEAGTKRVTRFSITGYSLGGLLARYIVGSLHHSKFFENVRPVNFTTIATPHLGIPVYPNLWSPIFALLGPRLLSRTGEQFYARDKWDGPDGGPLLEIMSRKDSVFYAGTCAFENITIYANTINDTTVPYLSAAIETEDPFLARQLNGIEIEFDEEYEPLVKSYHIPKTPPPPLSPPSKLSLVYWQSLRVPLPPMFQFRFPFNVPVYMLLPVILPLFLTYVVVRLSLEARMSEARIKLMDASKTEHLRVLFRGLEKGVDDAVADFLDRRSSSSDEDDSDDDDDDNDDNDNVDVDDDVDEGVAAGSDADSASSETTIIQEIIEETPTDAGTLEKRGPRLTLLQLKMAKSLNQIPNLKKKLAYIDCEPDGVRINSHAIIVSRDPKHFPIHERGMGIVRNWADSFVL